MKKNVLVFPCGSEVGLEINRALAQSTHFNLFGANSTNDHGKFVYRNYIQLNSTVASPDFIDELNQVIEEYEIDFIIPAHDSVVVLLAANQQLIGAEVIGSPPETCKICRSKSATYQLFKDLIPTPAVFNIAQLSNFPVFLKPDAGQGSKGTYKINTQEEADLCLKNDPTLLALEYLPGREYTVDCFTDKNGSLLFAEGRLRNRISNGISVNSKPVKAKEFQRLARVINDTLSFRGVWFFQLKERTDGELVLMEISSRIAGTMGLFRAMGVNFAQLSLFDRMGFDVQVRLNKFEIEVDRALFGRFNLSINYETVYVDFDDTLIVDNCVNTSLIKFLYQARNQEKKIVLVSKHIYNIKESLNRHAISSELFNEIIHLDNSCQKCDYLKDVDSIFIDDSFEERKQVMENLGIPCFGLDAVESLLCWKV